MTVTSRTADDVISEILQDHSQIKQLFTEVKRSDGGAKRDAFQQLLGKLAVHETAEEEVVHPAVRRTATEVVEQRLSEESKGKDLLHQLEEMGVEDARFQDTFATLEQEVLRHAEREEQEELPLLRRSVNEDELRAMARIFRAAENTAPTHPHPHGPESATGNLLVGPVVAIVDRVRDAIRHMRESKD